MRGILGKLLLGEALGRFNPAYAGNILSEISLLHSGQVQPRVCGEYLLKKTPPIRQSGSTPRMRGIFHSFATLFPIPRFNPAYAGNMENRLFFNMG